MRTGRVRVGLRVTGRVRAKVRGRVRVGLRIRLGLIPVYQSGVGRVLSFDVF